MLEKRENLRGKKEKKTGKEGGLLCKEGESCCGLRIREGKCLLAEEGGGGKKGGGIPTGKKRERSGQRVEKNLREKEEKKRREGNKMQLCEGEKREKHSLTRKSEGRGNRQYVKKVYMTCR